MAYNDQGDGLRRKFAVLKPRVKYIPQEIVRSKWKVIPEVVQDRVKEIFRSLERPVIMSHRDDGRRIEAQVAVGLITRTYVLLLQASRVLC